MLLAIVHKDYYYTSPVEKSGQIDPMTKVPWMINQLEIESLVARQTIIVCSQKLNRLMAALKDLPYICVTFKSHIIT